MPDPEPDVTPQSFEAALEELESLVGAMESGELSLEQSIAAHRRGMALTRYCQQALAQAQQQVRILEAETLASFPDVQPDR